MTREIRVYTDSNNQIVREGSPYAVHLLTGKDARAAIRARAARSKLPKESAEQASPQTPGAALSTTPAESGE